MKAHKWCGDDGGERNMCKCIYSKLPLLWLSSYVIFHGDFFHATHTIFFRPFFCVVILPLSNNSVAAIAANCLRFLAMLWLCLWFYWIHRIWKFHMCSFSSVSIVVVPMSFWWSGGDRIVWSAIRIICTLPRAHAWVLCENGHEISGECERVWNELCISVAVYPNGRRDGVYAFVKYACN